MIKLNGYFGEIELLYDDLKKQLVEQEIIIVEKSSWDELSACMHGKIKSKTHKPQGKIEEIKILPVPDRFSAQDMFIVSLAHKINELVRAENRGTLGG